MLKRGKGRPSQDKVMRPYTIDRKIVEFIDNLPDGERSKFVSNILGLGVELERLTGKFYNYVLMRPDGSVFYVGKGTGNRIDQHEMEAKRGGESYKCRVIRQIWEQGENIIKQKIAFFDDEQDAYRLEMLLIDFFGRENLTNCSNGGEGGGQGNKNRWKGGRLNPNISISGEEKEYFRQLAIQELQREPTDSEIGAKCREITYALWDKLCEEAGIDDQASRNT